MRVCVAGGGLAGSLLAWRLAQQPAVTVDLLLGQDGSRDATAASGGAVRAYETLAQQRGLAIASMAELLASPVLREWGSYQQTGFVYLCEGGDPAELAAEVAEIGRQLPGSARLAPAAGAFGDRTGAEDPGPGNLGRLMRVTVTPDRPVRVVFSPAAAGGTASEYDAVVLAAGAWTPGLLAACGLPATGYRTKSIQYSVYPVGGWCPPAFCDEATGLYGKPTDGGGLLLGVPTTSWDVPPGRPPLEPHWHERALTGGQPLPPAPARACPAEHERSGLLLRSAGAGPAAGRAGHRTRRPGRGVHLHRRIGGLREDRACGERPRRQPAHRVRFRLAFTCIRADDGPWHARSPQRGVTMNRQLSLPQRTLRRPS